MEIRRNALVLAVLCAFLLAGCGGDGKKETADKGKSGGSASETGVDSGKEGGIAAEEKAKVTGEIMIEGSSTVEPISNQAKLGFNADYANVEISVGGEGTSNGFKSFTKGETDISDASRPIKQKELDGCKENKVEFYELPVAYDGLTFVVNNDNEAVNELTIDQLKKIFVEGGVKTWKELDPAWPDEAIRAYMPGTGSGTYDYAYEVLAKKDGKKLRNENDIVTMSEQDNVLVDGVKKDKFGIGFFGFAYYESNKNDLKAVKIVNKAGKAVVPTMSTIESGEYAPFSRPLFIYVNKGSLDKIQVELFVYYYLENAKKLAEDAKYVALPQSLYDAAIENIEDEIVGTHFIDESGEKRSGALSDVFKRENIKK
jgi:phosphate transport system substrate-binding protein